MYLSSWTTVEWTSHFIALSRQNFSEISVTNFYQRKFAMQMNNNNTKGTQTQERNCLYAKVVHTWRRSTAFQKFIFCSLKCQSEPQKCGSKSSCVQLFDFVVALLLFVVVVFECVQIVLYNYVVVKSMQKTFKKKVTGKVRHSWFRNESIRT